MFKFRPTMTSLEKRENPADFQPMDPVFLTPPGYIFPTTITLPPAPTTPTTPTTTPTTP